MLEPAWALWRRSRLRTVAAVATPVAMVAVMVVGLHIRLKSDEIDLLQLRATGSGAIDGEIMHRVVNDGMSGQKSVLSAKTSELSQAAGDLQQPLKRKDARLQPSLTKSDQILKKLQLASEEKLPICETDCDKPRLNTDEVYPGLVNDEDSAYDTWNRASNVLGDLLPNDPNWDKYPSDLVLDPASDRGLLENALNTVPYDDSEDVMEDGGTGDSRLLSQGFEGATGCEIGDKDCIDLFIAQEYRHNLAWGYA